MISKRSDIRFFEVHYAYQAWVLVQERLFATLTFKQHLLAHSKRQEPTDAPWGAVRESRHTEVRENSVLLHRSVTISTRHQCDKTEQMAAVALWHVCCPLCARL